LRVNATRAPPVASRPSPRDLLACRSRGRCYTRPVRTLAPLRPSPARSAALAASVVLAFACAALGCTSSGSYREGEYSGGDADFHVGILGPEWTRLRVRDQNDLAFLHEPTSGVIQANASCQPGLDIPLEALRNHLLIGFTERNVVEERRIEVDGREALDVHVLAELDGVPVELRLTILKKNDCVFDMALVAAPDTFAGLEPQYDAFLNGFHSEGAPAPEAIR
jgi:hypothetical protein